MAIKRKALDVFNKAFDQLVPLVEVRPRRVGGSVYQIPTEVRSIVELVLLQCVG